MSIASGGSAVFALIIEVQSEIPRELRERRRNQTVLWGRRRVRLCTRRVDGVAEKSLSPFFCKRKKQNMKYYLYIVKFVFKISFFKEENKLQRMCALSNCAVRTQICPAVPPHWQFFRSAHSPFDIPTQIADVRRHQSRVSSQSEAKKSLTEAVGCGREFEADLEYRKPNPNPKTRLCPNSLFD